MKVTSMNGSTILNYNKSFTGGTEIMARGFEENILPIFSEFRNWNWILAPGNINLREDGKNIVWVHLGEFEGDLGWLNDPKVAYIIFVSHYQYHRFLERYNLDSKKCFVIENAINPIIAKRKPVDKIKLIFQSEPYRGLNVLLQALSNIKDDRIELHVFGDLDTDTVDFWKESMQGKIKDLCLKDSRVFLHGRVNHKDVLDFIGSCHIFAYPSTWRETSCLSLIEAMSAGCYCITNDLTVLPETGMGFVDMYEFTFDEELHVKRLQKKIQDAIENLYKFDPTYQITLTNKKHSWQNISNKWIRFGQELLDSGNITK